jgi:hypothetical protein
MVVLTGTGQTRVIHIMWVKLYKLCRVIKTNRLAVLAVMSGMWICVEYRLVFILLNAKIYFQIVIRFENDLLAAMDGNEVHIYTFNAHFNAQMLSTSLLKFI